MGTGLAIKRDLVAVARLHDLRRRARHGGCLAHRGDGEGLDMRGPIWTISKIAIFLGFVGAFAWWLGLV